tara:strand:+ start:2480 stop:3061 length:582 start_codon:yes stop_codon:yes gene_type:complete
MAIFIADVKVEIREVNLSDKPLDMLALYSRGTVPLLQLSTGEIIEESLEIMTWALGKHDPARWLGDHNEVSRALVAENDSTFKQHLDRYKYWQRHPEQTQLQARREAELFVMNLEHLLDESEYFFGNSANLADIAIFPFIRQFSAVDPAWFETAPYPHLRSWLNRLLTDNVFMKSMQRNPPWRDGDQACYFPP